MSAAPVLETARLRLRPFVPEDAPRLHELAGAREVADTTVSIPHPYPRELADRWIAEQARAAAEGRAVSLAIEFKHEPGLIGGISLRDIDPEHRQAELGFWIGVPWWGRGYALEATRAMVDYGFGQLGLNRIHAHHMVRNPASGRVLAKAGFQVEGLLRQRVRKWGRFEDVVLLALLRQDWTPEPGASTAG